VCVCVYVCVCASVVCLVWAARTWQAVRWGWVAEWQARE
jgi:hypothetical protein